MTVWDEEGYLAIIDEILTRGEASEDRTGVGTLRISGATMKWDASEGQACIPTVRRHYWKEYIKEMLWFISGNTNIRPLLQQNCTIWTEWPYKKYVDHHNGLLVGDEAFPLLTQKQFEQKIVDDEEFAKRFGDLGPVYGHQWRKFRGEILQRDICVGNVDGVIAHVKKDTYEEFDQLQWVIDEIKRNPTSRRLLVSAWNPTEVKNQALPPCHYSFQLIVTPSGRMDMILNMRSADTLLGICGNIGSYTALLRMICHLTGYKPGTLTWFGGDVHIYKNHIEGAKEMLKRKPRKQPTLILTPRDDIKTIDDFRKDDFSVEGYDPHPKISFDVAV